MKFKIISFFILFSLIFNQVFSAIYISEILPNTIDDKNLEYIELYNSGTLDQSLSGYILKDKSEKEFIFGSGDLLLSDEKKKYYRSETKILLNNSNEELYLYNASGSLEDSFNYENTEKGKKIIILDDNKINNNSGSIESNSGNLQNIGSGATLNGSGTVETNTGSGIIETNTGIIDDIVGTGILNNNTGGIVIGSGIVENSFLFPEIDIEVQSGLNYSTGSIWECKKTDCKINLNIEKIFTGSFLKKDYSCNWNFGTGANYSTGTKNKCNPGYVDYGTGVFDINLKLSEKDNIDNFITGGLVVQNIVIPLQSSPLEEIGQEQTESTGSIISNSGFVLEKLKIVYSFQNPSYLLEKDNIVDIYNCDRTKKECKINLDLRDSFTGSFKEKDFNCKNNFGPITGEENKCNPGTIVIPIGNHDFDFIIENKTNTGLFSTGSIRVINEGYLKPIKKKRKSSGGGSNYKKIIKTPIQISQPEIIIQSGLDEYKNCKKEECSINLKYEEKNKLERCVWKFNGGEYKLGTEQKCNPGYVKYRLGIFNVELKVYQKDREANYEIAKLKFSNSPLPSPLPEGEGIEQNEATSLPWGETKRGFLEQIKINKVLPNPHGTDNLEYIELINNSSENINLKGCSLDDKLDGGSKVYFFDNDIILSGKKKKYYKTQTKLNLNNTGDEVNFLCGGKLIDYMEWDFSIMSGYYLNHSRLNIVSGKAKVLKVIDGDTIKIKFLKTGKIETLRLIGIDTPETKHPNKVIEIFGKEASDYTKQKLLGKEVLVEIDNSNFRDKYSRLLGFIFIDGKDFNKELILKGYAKAYLKYSFKYSEDYKKAQKYAKKEKKGLWNNEKELKQGFANDIKIIKYDDEETIKLVDLNNNGIPDEFEEVSLEKISGKKIEEEKYVVDEIKSKQKYKDFVINGFTSRVTKLKSGLKISGKTIANTKVLINIEKNNEISFLDILINKVNANYFYETLSDNNGNYELLLTEIADGNFSIKISLIDPLGNIFKLEKEKDIVLEKEYINEMKNYVYEKYLKKLKKYSDEASFSNELKAIISLQGKIGKNKKLNGNILKCYDICSVNFDGSKSTGNIEKYIWNFGNGKSYIGKNPGYIKYQDFGKFNIKLMIIGVDGLKKESEFFVNFYRTPKKEKTSNKTITQKIIPQVEAIDYKREDDIKNNPFSILFYILIMIFGLVLIFILLRKEKLI